MRKKRFTAFLLSLAMAGTSLYTCGVIDVQAAAVAEEGTENPNLEQLAEIQEQAAAVEEEAEPEAQAAAVEVAVEPEVQAGAAIQLTGVTNSEAAWDTQVDSQAGDSNYYVWRVKGDEWNKNNTIPHVFTADDLGKEIEVVQWDVANGGAVEDTLTPFKVVGKQLKDAMDMITLSGDFAYTGKQITPKVTVSGPGDVSYSFEDGGIIIKPVAGASTEPGTAKVQVTMDGDDLLYRGTCEKEFTITKRAITGVKVTVNPNEYPYEGKKIEPDKKGSTVKVVETSNAAVELSKEDYTISWGNAENVGSANATVSLNTNSKHFTASMPQPFTSISNVFKIVSVNGAFTVGFEGHTGDAVKSFPFTTSVNDIKNAVAVSWNKLSVSTDDYDLQVWKGDKNITNVSGNLELGNDYTVKVSGKRNFQPTVKGEAAFEISGTKISENLVSVNIVNSANISYNGQQQKPAVNVELLSGDDFAGMSVNAQPLSLNKNYTVAYGDNVNAGTNAGTITITLTSPYSATKVVSFNIARADISANTTRTQSKEELTYNGGHQVPKFEVRSRFAGNAVLSSGDYAVLPVPNNQKNTASGNYKCVISGNGNYQGLTQEYDYQITQKSISDGDITCDLKDKYGYTGDQISPNFTMTYTRLLDPATGRVSANLALVKGRDYTVSCGDNFDMNSTGTVTITGIGNYKGTVKKTFEIGERDYSFTKVTVNTKNEVSYNGKTLSESDLNIKVYTGDDIELGHNQYTVSLGATRPENVGSYTLWINGKNDYNGKSISCNYKVTPRKFISSNVSVGDMVRYTYKNDGIDDPVGVVSDNATKKVLKKGVDYTVAVTNASTSSCTVTGLGNYSDDSIRRTYSVQKGIFGEVVSLNVSTNKVYEYNVDDLEIKATDLVVRDVDHNVDLELYKDYYVGPMSTVVNAGDVPVEIIAHSKSRYQGSFSTTVKVEPKNIEDTEKVLQISQNNYTESVNYTGASVEYEPKVSLSKNCLSFNKEILNSRNNDYTVQLRKDDVVSTNYKDAGTYDIVAVGQGNYKGVRVLGTLTVNKIPLKDEYFKLNKKEFNLGDPVDVYVQLANPELNLIQDRDFEIDYGQDREAQGSHIITIKGINNYEGTVELEYIVGPITLSEGNTEILYAGTTSDNKPIVQATAEGKSLRPDKDYTVVSISEIAGSDPKTWNVTIEGKGLYKGSVTKEVKEGPIRILDLNVEVSGDFTYNGQAQAPTAADVVVTVAGKVLSLNTDYTLAIPENTVDAASYDVVVTGTGAYEGEAKGAYEIKAISFAEENVTVGESVAYTGSNVTPPVTVTVGDKTLVAGVDYVIDTEADMQNVGEKTLTIIGIGNYANSAPITKTFQVVPASMSNAKVTVAAKTYTGAAQTADVTSVIVGNRVLTAGVDYTVETKRATNAGTTKVQITGKGNYTGTTTGNFVIRQRSIASAKVSGVQDRVYTSRPVGQTTSVKVVLDGKTLKRNTDYTFQFKNNTKIGVASFTLKGRGNYTGVTATQTFKILPKKGTINALKAGSKKFAVTAKRQGGGIQYQVQYRLKTSSRVTRVVSKKAKVVVRGLQKGKTYIVRVRAYKNVGGKNYYGEFSNARSIKIK